MIKHFSGYRVESRWSSGEQEYSVLPDETELRIPDLEPDQSYRFRIQAINERGASPFSGIFRSEALVRLAINSILGNAFKINVTGGL